MGDLGVCSVRKETLPLKTVLGARFPDSHWRGTFLINEVMSRVSCKHSEMLTENKGADGWFRNPVRSPVPPSTGAGPPPLWASRTPVEPALSPLKPLVAWG